MSEPVESPPTAFTCRFVTANLYRVPAWSPRRAGTIKLAQSADAHIWGLQESEEYERDIMPNLGGAWLEASDRSNITIIYRSDLFRRLWHGEYSVPADNRRRHHVMALLQHLQTGVEFLVVNAHMSNGSQWAAVRAKHAQAIVDQIAAQKRAGRIDDSTPVVVMGDFNDSRQAGTAGSPAGVFAAAGLWDITTNKARIDRVFARNAVLSGAVQIIRTIGTPDPSDHNWTQVDLDVGVGTPAPPPPPLPPPPPVDPPKPATIETFLPNLAKMPADAQTATRALAAEMSIDMFNPKSPKLWPNLTKALKAEDYWLAADNSGMKDRPVENRINKILYLQAAQVQQFNLDPTVINGAQVEVIADSVANSLPDVVNYSAWWTQAMLRELKLYLKKVDGLFGPLSRAAFAAYWPDGVNLTNVQALSDLTLKLAVV